MKSPPSGRSRFTSLAYRFALYIFLIFLSIGLVFSVLRASISLDRQLKRIENHLNNTIDESIAIISRDLWTTDYSRVLYQLNIIQILPYVGKAEIESNRGQKFTTGASAGRDYKELEFSLTYVYKEESIDLGKLSVYLDYDRMRGEILSAEMWDFAFHLSLVLILLVTVVLLFNSMAGRHLVAMTAFFRENREKDSRIPFQLKRRHDFPDELSLLTEAFNSFQKRNLRYLEHEQELSRKMEKLVQDKETFLSIISHDLRSPVSGFKNLTSLLVQDFDKLNTEELRTMLEELEKAGSRVYDLLENLLEWSALERGKLVPRKDRLSACLLLKSAIENLEQHARAKNIRLDLSCSADYFVAGDERMIMVVLRNLISNAIKYTPKGGYVQAELSEADSMLRFGITDTGVGMDPEKAAELFNRQQKTSSSGTAGEKGAGIGTVLAAEFIELQEGKIWARSKPGQGTSIFFTLREWKNV